MKYEITVSVTDYLTFTVDADTPEQALKIYQKGGCDGDSARVDCGDINGIIYMTDDNGESFDDLIEPLVPSD